MPVRMRGHKLLLEDAPPGGVLRSVKLTIDIEPVSGAALIYGAPTYLSHVRANGPHDVVELVTTEPVIFVQPIAGAETVFVGVLSHVDDLGKTYQFKGAPLTKHKVTGRGDEIEIGG